MLVWYFYHNEWTDTDKYYVSKIVFYLDFHSSTYHSFPTPGSHLGHYIAIITLDIYSVLFSLYSSGITITHMLYLLKLFHGSLILYSPCLFFVSWISDCELSQTVNFRLEPIVVILQFCYFFPLEFFVLYSWVIRFSVCVYYSLDFVCYAICLLK